VRDKKRISIVTIVVDRLDRSSFISVRLKPRGCRMILNSWLTLIIQLCCMTETFKLVTRLSGLQTNVSWKHFRPLTLWTDQNEQYRLSSI